MDLAVVSFVCVRLLIVSCGIVLHVSSVLWYECNKVVSLLKRMVKSIIGN